MQNLNPTRRSRLAATSFIAIAALSPFLVSPAASDVAKPIVALLLKENQTARYEARDKPTFEKQLAESCPRCQLKYYNASGDVSRQLSQAESALTDGAAVLVINPVDSNAAGAMVRAARQQNVKVMSYDSMIFNAGVDYAIKFDNIYQGVAGMKALVDKLKADGKTSGAIVMVNGDPADSGAAPEKKGAHSIADTSGFTVAAEYDTKGWSATTAQKEMQQAITKIGAANILGVYCGNDGMATGVIAALKGAGVDPLPPITGLDTQLDAVQDMVIGNLYESTYLPVETEATMGAKAAAALATGGKPGADLINGMVDDGKNSVPGFLLQTIPVTAKNMKQYLVDSGYLKVSQICTPDYAAACAKVGLTQ